MSEDPSYPRSPTLERPSRLAAVSRRAAGNLRADRVRSLRRIRAVRRTVALRRRQSGLSECSRHRHPCFAKMVLPDGPAGLRVRRRVLERGGARRFAISAKPSWTLCRFPLRLGRRLLRRRLLGRLLAGDRHQHFLLAGRRLPGLLGRLSRSLRLGRGAARALA
jgi:hypothetical protein